MKLKVFVTGLFFAACAAGYTTYDNVKSRHCANWLGDAEHLFQYGYYADTINQLTLYFSEDKCRSISDTGAVKLLAQSRLEVPLPKNAHLSQQLMLAKLGWKLKQDESYHLMEASASLVAGDWPNARFLARKAGGQQAALIAIAASMQLGDTESAKEDLIRFTEMGGSEFQWALLMELMAQESELQPLVKASAPPMSNDSVQLASLVSGNLRVAPDDLKLNVQKLQQSLTNEDLAIATSLLVTEGYTDIATQLLDQPERPLSGNLLLRHARLMWNQENYSEAANFLNRSKIGTMPAEIHLIVCLARVETNQQCTPTFDKPDFQRRHGVYAATRWNTLLSSLPATSASSSKVLDAISEMKDLVSSSAVVQGLAARLYASMGENALANIHLRRSIVLGAAIPSETTANEEAKSEQQINCDFTNNSCIAELLNNDAANFGLWRTALARGFQPSDALITKLKSRSPQEATLWRAAQARAAIGKQTDQAMAESLRLLRPVLRWTPNAALPQLLASAGTAYFADNDATYAHLATAAKSDPNSAVAALRLSLGYYQRGGVTSIELVHWWISITRLEMATRGIKASDMRSKNLLSERLSILAAEAENTRDTPLAIRVYKMLLEIAPNNHMASNNLAVKLMETSDNLEWALELASSAVQLNPNEAEYARTLEEIQFKIAALES